MCKVLFRASVRIALQLGKQMSSPMTFNSVTFAALMNPSANEAPGIKAEEQPAAAEEIKDVLRRLPHSKQTEMALVKERLDNFKREEAAANAAVAAVAKVPITCPLLLFGSARVSTLLSLPSQCA